MRNRVKISESLRPRWFALALLSWLVPAPTLAQPAQEEPGDVAPPAEEPVAPGDPRPSEPAEEVPAAEESAEDDAAAEGDEPPADPPPERDEAPPPPAAPPPAAPPPAAPPPAEVPSSPAPEEEEIIAVGEPEPEEEITISGSRLGRAPGSAHVIGKRQLERFEYDDTQAVLLQAPGVYVRQEDGIGLRPNVGIRGVSPDRSKKLTLMEDGILFGPAPYSAPAGYFFPLMTRMTQVRVIKGPSAIAYGPQTVGGAIDLISRPIPTVTSGGLDVGLGEYGYGKAHGYFGSNDGQTGFLVEGVRLQNSGFKELPDGANTGSVRNEWVAKASYVLDPAADVTNEFRLKLSYSDELSNETYLGLTDADFRRNPYRRYAASALDHLSSHRTGIVATHVLDAPESSIRVTTSAYRFDLTRSWNKLNRFGPGSPPVAEGLHDPELYGVLTGELDSATPGETLYIGPNARDYISQGVQSKVELSADTGPLQHRIEAGLRLHYDEIQRRHSESGYVMGDGLLLPDGQATRVTAKNRAATHAIAVHVLDAVTWADLTLTPGVRVEMLRAEATNLVDGAAQSHVVHAVLPGMGAFYGFTDHFGVLAGVHRGFSPPAPPDPGNPVEPGAEYSVNYEAGARYKAGAATVELIGFFSDYSNLTSICTFAAGCVETDLDLQVDAGAAHVYGLEAFAGHELPAGPVTIPFTLAYTYTRSEFLTSFRSADPTLGDVRPGFEQPYLPRQQVVATVGAETQRVGATVGAHYISPMREVAGDLPLDQTMATDSQFWLDVAASFRPLGYLTVYAQLRNALGAENIVSRRPYGARPNAPRWLQVGAKVDF